ncbi:hypothetical protein BE20_46685 [Sorangium cellulosum]|nr:hypothetical protein BE20_46685 [Sorangium cellulosum]
MSHHRCHLRRRPHERWRHRRGLGRRDHEDADAGARERAAPPGVPQTKPRCRGAAPLVALTRVARDERGGATVAQVTAPPRSAPFGRPA